MAYKANSKKDIGRSHDVGVCCYIAVSIRCGSEVQVINGLS